MKVYEKKSTWKEEVSLSPPFFCIIIFKAFSTIYSIKKMGCHAHFDPQLAYIEGKSRDENENLHRLKVGVKVKAYTRKKRTRKEKNKSSDESVHF